ncbi:hypothetical protein [Ferrovibrio sp.]|jgi:hypothetical protein|uniref:hypothetical protein n=2 Tax=Ferrovibrio sp. TaxID=1917215 RepID=UPI0035B3AF62
MVDQTDNKPLAPAPVRTGYDIPVIIIAAVIAAILLGSSMLACKGACGSVTSLSDQLKLGLFGLLIAFGSIVLALILTHRIDLREMLEDDNGGASLARFQMLLFTFVIAGLYLTVPLKDGALADIPTGVLGLIGISGGTYMLSKGISKAGSGNP